MNLTYLGLKIASVCACLTSLGCVYLLGTGTALYFLLLAFFTEYLARAEREKEKQVQA
jgi:hypothetical protein